MPIRGWATGINKNFIDWAFLSFASEDERGAYPPLTESDSFKVSSNDFLEQLALPAEVISKDLDEFIPGGKPLGTALVCLQWLLIVSVNAQTLSASFVREALTSDADSCFALIGAWRFTTFQVLISMDLDHNLVKQLRRRP